jgi:ubiquinone/menaquinone biosynthesis C-methylase UbiE
MDSQFAPATKLKPDWAGDDWLSKLVNLLIKTRPIYALMKRQARQVLIQTAEKNGILWRQEVAKLEASGVKDTLKMSTSLTVAYPDYYQQPFHAYEQGNLCWQAAFEATPATYAMGLRVWPQEGLTAEQAQARLRSSFHQLLAAHGPQPVNRIVDLGCSVGISTRSLHQFYQATSPNPVETTGLDLSPYMLAVAQAEDSLREIQAWVHAQAEQMPFADGGFDLATLQFVIHELPRQATASVFQEIKRILRSGGCLAIVDNNPQSAVIQNLPPVLFTLMKSTEPWSDDYYTFDVEACLAKVGYIQIQTYASDPRHRTILAFKP